MPAAERQQETGKRWLALRWLSRITGRIQAGASLLNKGKVETGRECDRFEMVGWIAQGTTIGVIIISRDGRSVLNPFGRVYCLRKREPMIQIRIVGIAAIPGPKASIHI